MQIHLLKCRVSEGYSILEVAGNSRMNVKVAGSRVTTTILPVKCQREREAIRVRYRVQGFHSKQA